MSIVDRRMDRAATGGGAVVSDLDLRYAAQIRAAGVLSDLLVMAGEAALPSLSWSVNCRGGLSGLCVGVTDAGIRASFEAWMQLLGAQRLYDDRSADDGVILRGRVEQIRGCEVRLSAYLSTPAGGTR